MTDQFSAQNFLETVDLDRIRVLVQHKINRYEIHSLHHLDVGRYVDDMTNSIAFEFRAFCLGEKQQPIKLKPMPTSWWQMFKRDIMPKWFVKRFPVKSEEVTIDVAVLYPHLKISIPPSQSSATIRMILRPSPIVGFHG